MADAQHPFNWTATIALCGALFILGVFALIDAYAIHSCFRLARSSIPLPDICTPEHIFRTALEIGGMAVGLYGASRLIK